MTNSERFPIMHPVIALVGPTAIGKTELSLSIADNFDCEIVSLDSMQVYRYMDIGTAKASPEERKSVPHHLIDIIDPDTPYDASIFTCDAVKAIRDIHGRNKIPLLTGGTGLYLRSLTEGLFDEVGKFPQLRKELSERLKAEGRSKLHAELLSIDPNSGKRIHINDTQRLLRALEIYYATGKSWTEHLKKQPKNKIDNRFDKILQLGLTCERDLLYERINQRTSVMINNGLKEEVEWLVSKGYDRSLKSMQSIGYRHMVSYLFDGWTDEKLKFLLSRDTRRYAKRQFTWFRKMEIEWHDVSKHNEIELKIKKFLS